MSKDTIELIQLAFTLSSVIVTGLFAVLVYWIKTERKKLFDDCKAMILEYYYTMENLIREQTNKIQKINIELKHKDEIDEIKEEILEKKIQDMERFLSSETGYTMRSSPNNNNDK